jgi:hypothetical protein
MQRLPCRIAALGGNMKSDIQPMQPHKHYHSITVQLKTMFEPVMDDAPTFDEPLYRMVEYAYLACACGDVIKSTVRPRITS